MTMRLQSPGSLCCRQAHSSIGNLPTATTQNRIPSLAAYALADQSDGTQVSQADRLAVVAKER